MRLEARKLCWSAGGVRIVDDISFEVSSGEFIGIVGPNGSGKSTLLSMLSGTRRPQTGNVILGREPILKLGGREVARRLAFVEQQAETSERITARQAVELGRTPYLSPIDGWSPQDDAIVDAALKSVDMLGMADRYWQSLSGGERQRLHIGRALAQEPSVLLLDEPTNHLDIGHQMGLLDLVRRQQLTVLAALHDLNHATMFCDRIVVMDHGKIVAIGPPREALTTDLIREIFGVESTISQDEDGIFHIRFKPLQH